MILIYIYIYIYINNYNYIFTILLLLLIRLRMDSYKGMTAEEVKAIRDYQELQRQENNVNFYFLYR